MQKTDFQFDLPSSLIAQYPTASRTGSRLLHLNRKTNNIQDKGFADILRLLNPGDLLVMNNTRVIPARLYGKKDTGGKVEVLIERVLDRRKALAFVRASKSPKLNSRLNFNNNEVMAEIIARHGDLFELQFSPEQNLLDVLHDLGEIPLPPYMTRAAGAHDTARYQTVFAKYDGAVAAPTAGLHFDEKLMQEISRQGVNMAYVTLHVGAGTFMPVRVGNILEHKMHKERIEVTPAVCEQIRETRKNGGRVIAVGTTVVRSLESAALGGVLQAINEETDIFIYPGFKFNVVDALITNFHLSESTLLMLVCAFADRKQILDAYAHAVKEKYRFFSYGDAMFIS
ncbi:MAG TPA: tRNA preQ1(34) S-adenosylmethionine ribosyltransferase-isomerase QueA [Gammaproteobacteria bacterium]|nr:tRNA preQ1(34) S-adenosylmethionine ribosyltransferase-isomerase QueA [Gammaproteobacteria bacterium]